MVVLKLALQRNGSHEILYSESDPSAPHVMVLIQLRTQVFAKVLNLNDRSRASPSAASVHRPPEVERRGVTTGVRAAASVPEAKRGEEDMARARILDVNEREVRGLRWRMLDAMVVMLMMVSERG